MEVLFYDKERYQLFVKTPYGYEDVTYSFFQALLTYYFNIDMDDFSKMMKHLEKETFPERFI